MPAPNGSASLARRAEGFARNEQPPPSPPPSAPFFVANHHRSHNPDDPKLRANPSAKNKRASIFGGMLKTKSKDSYKGKSSISPTTDGITGLLPLEQTTSVGPFKRSEHNKSATSLNGRSGSRSRRQSLGATNSRGSVSMRENSQREARQTLNERAASVSPAVVHDKLISNHSRPPSDHVRDDSVRMYAGPLDSPLGTMSHEEEGGRGLGNVGEWMNAITGESASGVASASSGGAFDGSSVPPASLTNDDRGRSADDMIVVSRSDTLPKIAKRSQSLIRSSGTSTSLADSSVSLPTASSAYFSAAEESPSSTSLMTARSNGAADGMPISSSQHSVPVRMTSRGSNGTLNSDALKPIGGLLAGIPASASPTSAQTSPYRVRLQPRDPVIGGSTLQAHPKGASASNGRRVDPALDEETLFPTPKPGNRRMSVLDFLSSEPPPKGPESSLSKVTLGPVTPGRRPTSTFVPASMPLLSAQQQTVAGANGVVSDPQGGPLAGERSSSSSNPRSCSSVNAASMPESVTPNPSRASAVPAGVLGFDSELEIGIPSNRSNLAKVQTLPSKMQDDKVSFLPAVWSSSAPRKAVQADLAEGVALSVEPLVDDVVMFGSTQTSSNYSLSGTVVLSIPRRKPESKQLSQDAKGRSASIDEPPSPKVAFHRHTSSVANPGSPTKQRAPSSCSPLAIPSSSPAPKADPAEIVFCKSLTDDQAAPRQVSDDRQGQSAGAGSARPSIKVESLIVTFSGYALYADRSGRYNSIKLANVSQDLLQEGGCVCYADGEERQDAARSSEADPHQLHTAPAQPSGPIKYEVEFDLAVPGWLPGSLKSRFGGTFYCLEATATIDGKQKVLSSSAGWSAPVTAGSPYIFGDGRRPQFLNPFFASTGHSGSPGDDAGGHPSWMRARRSSYGVAESGSGSGAALSTSPDEVRPTQRASAFAHAGPSASIPRLPTTSSSASRPIMPARSKNSWLGKRAKQLQLRSSKKSSNGSGSGVDSADERGPSKTNEATSDRRGSAASSKDTKASALNVVLPSGKRQLKSQAVAIIIRRCRDVVPVPVARMALIGSDRELPGLRLPVPAPAASSSLSTQPDGVRNVHATLVQSQSGGSIVASATNPRGMVPSASVPALSGPSPPSADPGPAAAIAPTATAGTSGSDDQANLTAAASATCQTAVDAEPVTETAATDMVTTFGREGIESTDGMLPLAPSAFDMPSDPAKFTSAASIMSSSATTSSLSTIGRRSTSIGATADLGNTRSPPRTSSRPASGSRSSAPMRHFLHRPVLHPPAELGIFGKSSGLEGLPFSLTLSLPSHVQVSGPKSDTLSFGVQIEVGKSEGWNAVRKLGGLRLQDMELVCLQTERHSSIPSRTFCAAFRVPPPPNRVSPQDLPAIGPSRQKAAKASAMSSAEIRLRHGYDRDLVLNHLAMVNDGTAPDPVANNVERTKTTIVGPPPTVRPPRGPEGGHKGFGRRPNGKGKERESDKGNEKGKGKEKDRKKGKDGSASLSGTATPTRNPFAPTAQLGQGSGSSVMQPRPRSAVRSRASSSSLRNVFANASAPESVIAVPNVTPADAAGLALGPDAGILASSSEATEGLQSSGGPAGSSSRSQEASAANTPKPVSRRRRGFQNAMSRLSNLANSMLDAGLDYEQGQEDDQSPNSRARDNGFPDETNSRATYVFSGEDGDGVDLTRGRVRMTIKLPLVSWDPVVARGKGSSAQLLSDFESPYIRIRHKLKVKLGFGLNQKSDREEQSWSQALVMCVPVRFTESPPKEVQDQFAPITVRPAGIEGSSTRPWPLSSTFVPVPSGPELDGSTGSSVPLLPAYTQLFREDGSRLADEGEDLPQYPGRMSVTGEIVVDDREDVDEVSAGTLRTAPGLSAATSLEGIPESSAVDGSSQNVAEECAGNDSSDVSAVGLFADSVSLDTNEGLTAMNMPTPMDRSTSLPGHRSLLRALSGEHANSPLKSSTSSSMLQQHSTGHEMFANRPPVRQRSATSASLASFSCIAPAEVLDEALMLNALEDDEARRDAKRAMNAEEDEGMEGDFTEVEGEGEVTDAACRSSLSQSSAERRMSEEEEGETTFQLDREERAGRSERSRMNSEDDEVELVVDSW